MEGTGQRIRAARVSRGLSLRELASLSGCSASSISQVERGLAQPRVTTLLNLATPLGVTLSQLLSDDRSLHQPLRRAERVEMRFGKSRREYPLTRRPRTALEVYVVVLEPRGTSDHGKVTHGDSDEFCLLMSGDHVLFEIDQETHRLDVDDAMEWRSSVPHVAVNDSDTTAELLWAITPPTPVGHRVH